MRRMFDAAFPQKVIEFGVPVWEALAGYVGGNTPHLWTKDEWNQLINLSGAQFALPIYARSNPLTHDPTQDAKAAISMLNLLEVQKGVCVALDLETAIAPAYVKTFDQQIMAAGWKVIAYGSKSTIFLNGKPSGGHWVAEWTGKPHLYPGSAATQWANSDRFGGAYDASLVADTTPLWRVGKEITMADAQSILDALGKLRKDLTVRGTTGLAETMEKLYGHAKNADLKADQILLSIAGIDEGMSDQQAQAAAATMANTLSASLPSAFVSALKEAL